MPELPDVELYLHAFREQLTGETIKRVIIKSPFVVRSFEIEVSELCGKSLVGFSRIGKRIVWRFPDELFVAFHLMIAGRFHMKKPGVAPRSKVDLAAFQFENMTLMLTEAASKKRASLHVVRGNDKLLEFDRCGLDVLNCTVSEFADRLRSQNRTIKIAMMDPTTLDGVGNAYSDEILHDARLSPFQRTSKLTDAQIDRLLESTRRVLLTWIERLQEQNQGKFPERITAFRPEMAVHGKFGKPCPICDHPIQRIVYADKQWNYCAKCQTDGKLLADRSLSRLLRDEWPKTVDEL